MRSFPFACLLIASLCASAQSLRLSPAEGAPGDPISLTLSLSASSDSPPAALQWELVYPARLLAPATPEATLDPAVSKAGKTLNCAARNSYTTICILSGGASAIPDGPVTVIHLKILADAKPGSTTVRLAKIQGVTASLKPLTFPNLEATVGIR